LVKLSFEKSFLAGVLEKGDERAWVFDKRRRELIEYLKGKVTGFVGRLEDNVLYIYTTYVNI